MKKWYGSHLQRLILAWHSTSMQILKYAQEILDWAEETVRSYDSGI